MQRSINLIYTYPMSVVYSLLGIAEWRVSFVSGNFIIILTE